MSGAGLPKPKSWDEFEEIVWDLFARKWNDPQAKRYGRSGQEQQGVDVYGRPRELNGGYVGVQCKRYEDGKLDRKVVEAEILKAEQFRPPLAQFIIATTAGRDAGLQKAVREINREREGAGKFGIDILFWDELSHELLREENEDLLRRHYAEWLRVFRGEKPATAPYNNLPRPDYAHFIGRQAALDRLRELLSPQDRAWQIAITGIGGVGKSALALAIAHEYREKYEALPPDERYEAIVWISAKEEVLSLQGKEKANLPITVLRTLEDIYNAVARVLDREDITRALPQDQGYIVQKALQEQRTLLVMDNLESVTDERIKPFLRNLPAPTKALITSREWLNVAEILTLKGLSPEEADAFIQDETSLRQVNLDGAQRQRIYDFTWGLPLPIKLAIARLAGEESYSAVERWLGDATGDLPEYCITGQVELAQRREPGAGKLLLACSLFDRSAGAASEALGDIADLSIVNRENGLTQLERLFLVNRSESGRYWVLPIVERYVGKILAAQDQKKVISRWLAWMKRFSVDVGGDFRFKIDDLPKFGVEYPNILKAIRLCRQKKNWKSLLTFIDNSWSYPYLTGLFNDYQEMADYLTLAAKALNDQEHLGISFVHLSRLAWVRNDFDKSLELSAQAEAILYPEYQNRYLFSVWTTMAHIYDRRGEFDRSEELARKMLAIGHEANDLYLLYEGSYRLSALASHRENFDAANKYLDDALTCAIQLGNKRQIIQVNYRRAANMMAQGQFEAAEGLLIENINSYLQIGEHRHVADNKFRLAVLYHQTGRDRLAGQMARDAQEIFQKIGMIGTSLYIDQFINELRAVG